MTLYFNKDRTIMIDLDKVVSYQFYPEHKTVEIIYPATLVINCDHHILNINTKDANQLLDLLKLKYNWVKDL